MSSGERRGVDWRFNAWGGLAGGLYFPWDQDDLVAHKVLEIEGSDRYRAPIINEGGAIHVDGEGTALVTEQVLLNPNRNPGMAKDEIERHLKAYLGVQSVIWLGDGVIDDETGGHVDNLACFVRPGAVALHWTDNKRDPQFAVSQDAFERLAARATRAAAGSAVHQAAHARPAALSAGRDARGAGAGHTCADASPACGWPRAT